MPGEPRYKFEEFELDGAAQTLRRNGEDLALRPQLFAVLRLLVEHPNETVTKDQFFDSIWQGDHSAAASLNTAIKELRKLLGDEPKDARFIRTKAGWGYQFVAPVTVIQPSPPREEPPSQPSAKAAPRSQAAVPSGRPKRRILWFMAAAGVAALTTIAGLATWPRSAEVEEVGWWRPQTAANGIVEDRTGHGNTGKVTGHLRQTEGRHGPAGYFDGSTYITGTTPGNNFPEGADPFAIAMWIRTTVQDPNSRHLFHFGDRLRLPARNSTYLAMYKGGLSVFGFGLTYDEAGGHTRINDGRWHHLVGLYEGRGSSLMMLYLDGEENGRAIAR